MLVVVHDCIYVLKKSIFLKAQKAAATYIAMVVSFANGNKLIRTISYGQPPFIYFFFRSFIFKVGIAYAPSRKVYFR